MGCPPNEDGVRFSASLESIQEQLSGMLKSGIEARTVHAALDRIFELVGCPSCGFNGILDLHLDIMGPTISERFGKGGVLGASQNLGNF